MVTMPDGVQFDMRWKQVKYSNGSHSIVFEIVPMLRGSDLVVFPNTACWTEILDIFSDQERMEIIFLLERIDWKRDLRIIEANVTPVVNMDIEAVSGSIESTAGYQKLTSQNLFDPQCPYSKSQVKEIYCILEKRFAESASGIVSLPRDVILKGSVLEEVSIPALKKNKDVVLKLT
jgi:hypothetical protein